MITQKLINYINTQLSAGIEREKITSVLLNQEGWTMEQINEAFKSAGQSTSTEKPKQEIVTDSTQTPRSIKYFEWLMYASLATGGVILIYQFALIRFPTAILVAMAVPFIVIIIKFVCVYRIVYHRAKWARIILVILLALNAFLIFGFFFYAFSTPIILFTALPIVFEIAAIYFVFTTPSNTWLTSNTQGSKQGIYIANRKKWTKIIPRLNIGFMVISTLLVFGLDLMILIDSPELAPFFYAMLVVLAIFVAFFFYENKILKRKFASSDSKLDSWFVALVVLRDIVFVLNFIPFIQILGGTALVFGGIPYLIIYFLMLRARNKSITTV